MMILQLYILLIKFTIFSYIEFRIFNLINNNDRFFEIF